MKPDADRRCPRAAVFAIVTVALLGVTGCGAAGSSDIGAPEIDSTVVGSPSSPEPVTVRSPGGTDSANRKVAVIGDSFSSGSANDVVWPDVLAALHRVDITNASLSGSGYVAGADDLGTFADQVSPAASADPSVVLVVGSENDYGADPGDVRDRAAELFRELRNTAPRARVVVIGPIWSGGSVPDDMWDIDAAVETEALFAGLDYVDTLGRGWLDDPAIIQDDGDHPTDEGQYLLAADIDSALSEVDPHLLG